MTALGACPAQAMCHKRRFSASSSHTQLCPSGEPGYRHPISSSTLLLGRFCRPPRVREAQMHHKAPPPPRRTQSSSRFPRLIPLWAGDTIDCGAPGVETSGREDDVGAEIRRSSLRAESFVPSQLPELLGVLQSSRISRRLELWTRVVDKLTNVLINITCRVCQHDS